MTADRVSTIIRALFLTASVALCLLVSVAYVTRPDSLAGLTFWPVWSWAVPGAFLAVLAWTRKGRGRKIVAGVLLLWVVYAAVFAEEPRSLLRSLKPAPSVSEAAAGEAQALRVISMNCSIATKAASEEVIPYSPDIVLLQESPVDADVLELARKLYGDEAGVALGHDTAIIARGEVKTMFPLVTGRELKALSSRYYTRARVKTPSGLETEVISVHLIPPVLREDIWSKAYWRDYRDRRLTQRAQMRRLAQDLEDLPGSVPIIAGGDYNAPAGDAIFRLLQPRLRDAFYKGGRGWCNTVINEFPVSRIDQIWVSRQFDVVSVTARRTRTAITEWLSVT